MKDESIRNKAGRSAEDKMQVLVREMPADLETPVSAFLKLREYGARVLLESVESGTILGRYSFIGIKPNSKIIVNQNDIILKNNGDQEVLAHAGGQDVLNKIKEILDHYQIESSDFQPPLLGGAVGYISYDFARFFEPIPNLLSDDQDMPLALFYLIDTLLVFDHVQRRLKIMCLQTSSDTKGAENKLAEIAEILRSPLNLQAVGSKPQSGRNLVSNFTEEEFCQAVVDVKKHIVAGDVYQQVISQRLSGTTDSDSFMIYRALRMLNPSPYMFYLDFDQFKLIGSSPEALVRLENGQATVRPIAGTRPRGANEKEDLQLELELLADEKERAEHVMLVDLGRNDLGRCCEIGSVKVTDFMTVERYSHVMHMTSNVVGQLKPNLSQFDLFRAAFPAGTVTGAPKIRAMQLIEGFEKIRRGAYAGAAGYFSLSGDMDWCITIRTIIMKDKNYYLQAGAGIVADSVPDREYKETLHKIMALKKAIEMAEEGF